MVFRSATLRAQYLGPFVEQAESLGLQRPAVVRSAGLPADILEDPGSWVSVAMLERLIRAVVRATGREDFGLDAGRRFTLSTHGRHGIALMRCSDLHEAFELHARQYPCIAPAFAVEYRRELHRATLLFRPVVGMSHMALRILNEAQLASFHSIVTAIVGGRMPPYDVWHSTERPRYAARYEQLVGARVRFGQGPLPELRIEFDAGLTEIPIGWLPRRDVADDPDDAIRGPHAPPAEETWADWVRLMLGEATGCLPTLEQVAGAAGLSSQGLGRRLAREGQSYRRLSNEARLNRAVVLLREGQLPIARISESLGYQTAANFSTAFRRATGIAPRQFRRMFPARRIGLAKSRHARRTA